jgi:hypothetical protein
MRQVPATRRLFSPFIRLYLTIMTRYDRPSHRVYMTFFSRSGWQVQFCEADLKTPLPRRFTFADPEKIRELARRGEPGAIRRADRCSSTG